MKTVKVAGDDPELIKFAYAEIPFSMLGPIVESFEDKSFCIDAEEGKNVTEIAKKLKRSKLSISYRIHRVLLRSSIKSFKDIQYRTYETVIDGKLINRLINKFK